MTDSVTVALPVNKQLVENGTITEAYIKERLLEYIHKRVTEEFGEGYVLTEVPPPDAFMYGPDYHNMTTTTRGEYRGALVYELTCKFEPIDTHL